MHCNVNSTQLFPQTRNLSNNQIILTLIASGGLKSNKEVSLLWDASRKIRLGMFPRGVRSVKNKIRLATDKWYEYLVFLLLGKCLRSCALFCQAYFSREKILSSWQDLNP